MASDGRRTVRDHPAAQHSGSFRGAFAIPRKHEPVPLFGSQFLHLPAMTIFSRRQRTSGGSLNRTAVWSPAAEVSRWRALLIRVATILIGAMVLVGGALAAETGLLVQAIGQTPVHLSLEDLTALPSQEVSVQDERGKPARYRGVLVSDVLVRAGAPLPVLRGKVMTQTLLVNAADGYGVVFALPELDVEFTAAQVLVCFERDGHPMDDQEGPLRIVVPNEKKHARWVRRAVGLIIQPGVVHEN
jgi:hypothetical protein